MKGNLGTSCKTKSGGGKNPSPEALTLSAQDGP